MSDIPREEKSYKEVYPNTEIDINKELNIDWSKYNVVKRPQETYKTLDSACFNYDSQMMDSSDKNFCDKNNIDYDKFFNLYNECERLYNFSIQNKLLKLPKIKLDESCDICGKSDVTQENFMVTCQGCHISVHVDCYGIVDDREGWWLCIKCVFYFEKGYCKYCPVKKGIFKRTIDNEFCHAICAYLIPGLTFDNKASLSPVNTENIKYEENATCSFCNQKIGAIIKCCFLDCKETYHASCCVESYYCDINNKITYCNEHRPDKHLTKQDFNRLKSIRHKFKEVFNRVIIRAPISLKNRVFTKFIKILKSEPTIKVKGQTTSKIAIYWKQKRRRFGSYLSNIFIAGDIAKME